jgi:hypothetical protein
MTLASHVRARQVGVGETKDHPGRVMSLGLIKSTVPVSDDRVASHHVEARHVPSGTVMTRGTERLTYEIRVRGDLTDALVAALKPLGLRVENTSDGPILIGVFRDQAELHGVLEAMQDLGVELVEMRQRAAWT